MKHEAIYSNVWLCVLTREQRRVSLQTPYYAETGYIDNFSLLLVTGFVMSLGEHMDSTWEVEV